MQSLVEIMVAAIPMIFPNLYLMLYLIRYIDR